VIEFRHFFKKSWVKKTLLSMRVSVIALVLFVALILNLLRIYLPGAFNNERLYFEQWASEAVHVPVQIQSIHVRWYHFSPMIEFTEVKILDVNKKPKAQIQRLSIEIDLLGSLLKWTLLPGTVLLDGAQLELVQDENNQLQLGQIDYFDGKNLLRQTLNFNETVTWLLTQGTIIIQNLDIHWKRPDGSYFSINKINLQIMDKGFDRAIGGSADLPDNLGDHVAFGIVLKNLDIKKITFDADVYLGINKVHLQSWAKLPFLAPYLKTYVPTQGEGDLQAWIKWRKMQLKLVQAHLDFSKLVINTPATSKKWVVSDLSANIAWKHSQQGWSLLGDHLRVHLNDKEWLENAFGFREFYATDEQAEHQIIAFKSLRLYDLKFFMDNWSEIPESVKTLYLKLKPQGDLNHIVIEHSGDTWDANSLKLSLDFANIRTETFDQWPGVSNFGGRVYWSTDRAQLNIKSSHFMLRWPKFFPKAVTLKTVQSVIDWVKNGSDWTLKTKSFYADDSNLLLQARALFTHTQLGNQLSINSQFKVNDLTQVAAYLPRPIMDEDLYVWLSAAFKRGGLLGTFVFEGDPEDFPFDKHEGRFEAVAQMKDIDLQFDPAWPMVEKINGTLLFDDAQMHVDDATAMMMKNPVHHLNAAIPNLAQGMLTVWGHIDSNLEFAEEFLLKTPLPVGQKIKSLILQGPMTLDLKIKLPLNAYARAHSESETLGNLSVEDATVKVVALGEGLTDLKGQFSFTDTSLIAPEVTAELFSQPVKINIDTVPGAGADLTKVAVNLSGQLDIDQAQKAINSPWLKFFHGSTPYQAQLILNPPGSINPDTFSLDSNLQGISIAIDTLYEKKAEQPEALKFAVSLAVKDKLTQMSLSYGSQLSAALSFDNIDNVVHFVSGQVALGTAIAKQQTAPGLAILLTVPTFDWGEWQKILDKYSALFPETKNSTEVSSDLLTSFRLKTDKLIAYGHELQTVDVQLKPTAALWSFNVNSPALAGTIEVSRQGPLSLKANLQRLYFQKNESMSSGEMDLSQWPAMNIKIGSFRYMNRTIGNVDLESNPIPHGIELTKLQLSTVDYSLNLSGDSKTVGSKVQTELSGQVRSANVGNLLRNLNLSDSLVNGQGVVNFSAKWIGSFISPNLPSLEGLLDINLQKGVIVNLSSKAQSGIGLSRMLNLFSLQGFPSLGHLTQKGLYFTILKGNFKLQKGNAISSNVFLDGPVAKIIAKGRIGYVAHDFDITMTVRPYVTSSLPTVAAFAGGPIVGVVGWLVNKVIVSPLVSRAVQFEYRVTGPWSKPVIAELEKPKRQKK